MTDPVREQVLGYLLGALDDAEMEQVQELLQTDETYRHEWAALRRKLDQLDAAQPDYTPPRGLAERTCQFVLARTKPSPRRSSRGQSISPQAAPPNWAHRIGWLDMTVALSVFIVAGLLTLPAIQSSRFNSRLATCSDNLRELGTSLCAYSRSHNDCFPRVPTEGKLAAAGIYAPTLLQGGYLTQPKRLVCPDSPLADKGIFRVPTLDQIQAASDDEAAKLRQQMGGSYGYCIGYLDNGTFRATKNLQRPGFALMADAPREDRPDHQSDDHGGRGQNVLFEDGHVGFLTSSHPSALADDIFANDNNLVAAGLQRDDSVIASSGVTPVLYVSTGLEK
jgi:hypothetical protein